MLHWLSLEWGQGNFGRFIGEGLVVFRDAWEWEAVGGTPGLCWFGLKVLEAPGKYWVGR